MVRILLTKKEKETLRYFGIHVIDDKNHSVFCYTSFYGTEYTLELEKAGSIYYMLDRNMENNYGSFMSKVDFDVLITKKIIKALPGRIKMLQPDNYYNCMIKMYRNYREYYVKERCPETTEIIKDVLI